MNQIALNTTDHANRALNSSPFRLTNGVLTVTGTGRNDVIRIWENSGILRASLSNGSFSRRFAVNKSRVRWVTATGGNGHDVIDNLSSIRSTLRGGHGNDRLVGGQSRDYMYGNSGSDVLIGRAGNDVVDAGSGNDVVRGGSGGDYIRGSFGNDRLFGESHNDIVIGDAGADQVWGGSGNDRMWGGSGNDKLVGGEDVDYLIGGSGADALMGGNGLDYVWGQSGADRYLVTSQDSIRDYANEDAAIYFYAAKQESIGIGSDRITFAGGRFTESEIMTVDRAFETLYRATGSTRLLKLANGSPMKVFRHGKTLAGDPNVLAWNTGGQELHLPDNAFNMNEAWVRQNILHEIAHNWDDYHENSSVGYFRNLSGWQIVNNQWQHRIGATNFVRSYGQSSPHEDFATAFAAYFLKYTRLTYQGGPGGQQAPYKMNYMRWFAENYA